MTLKSMIRSHEDTTDRIWRGFTICYITCLQFFTISAELFFVKRHTWPTLQEVNDSELQTFVLKGKAAVILQLFYGFLNVISSHKKTKNIKKCVSAQ